MWFWCELSKAIKYNSIFYRTLHTSSNKHVYIYHSSMSKVCLLVSLSVTQLLQKLMAYIQANY